MRAIILAAGVSSRLYPLTLDKPKCLLEVSGKKIIDYQIEGLRKAGVDDILVVTGFLSDRIHEYLKGSVRYHFFPGFKKYNNLYTLQSAKQYMMGGFICLFSDVLLRYSVLRRLVRCEDDFCLLVCRGRVLDGTMKIRIKNDSVCDIGNHISSVYADGNFVGAACFSSDGACLLSDEIDSFVECGCYVDDYYTAVLPSLYRGGCRISFIDVKSDSWIEVDTLDDLKRAQCFR